VSEQAGGKIEVEREGQEKEKRTEKMSGQRGEHGALALCFFNMVFHLDDYLVVIVRLFCSPQWLTTFSCCCCVVVFAVVVAVVVVVIV